MNQLRRLLRYEIRIRFTVEFLLAVVVIDVVVNAIWPHTPGWIFFLIGAALALGEGWMLRRTNKAKASA
jgi:hypothetical protein